MARILLGWELGGSRGHLVRLIPVAQRLAAAGHDVAFALQRIDGLPAGAPNFPVWQAPIWPRLLVNVGRPGGPQVATMGDILARIGFDSSEIVAAIIGGWERILAAFAPQLVIADFAPGLLLAARERLPVLSVGPGFQQVPSHLDHFPSLTGAPSVHDEGVLLEGINAALAARGLGRLDRYPQVFAAGASVTGSFSELDPYAAHRDEPLVAPSLAHPVPATAGGGGDEVFVYASEDIAAGTPLWAGLGRSGLPVRVHVARATPAMRRAIDEAGLSFEPDPLPFTAIAERSRLLVSSGGAGFVSSGLIAGIPQVVAHHDLEKALNGNAVMQMGLGGQVPLAAIEPEAFASSLSALYDDQSMAARARAAAPGFRARAEPSAEHVTVTKALEMLG